jgi:hypothetical protein
MELTMISRMYKPNEKTTANKLAKEIVLGVLDIATYWEEQSGVDLANMTEKEKEEVHRLVIKQIKRINNLLSK